MFGFLGSLLTGWLTSLWSGLVGYWAGKHSEAKDQQIAKDADEIQSLKKMQKIQQDNADLADTDIFDQLLNQTARRPDRTKLR